jgi:histidyl-tRNA synthetase
MLQIKEVFDGLGWQGKYTIKMNHRKILGAAFSVCYAVLGANQYV